MVDDDKARSRWAIPIFIVVLGVVTGLIAWNAWHRAAEPYRLAQPQPMSPEAAAQLRASIRAGIPAEPGAKPPHVIKAEEDVKREPSYTDGVEAAIEKRRKAEEAAQAEKEAADAERLGAPDAADKRAKANGLRKEADRLKEEAAPAETAPK